MAEAVKPSTSTDSTRIIGPTFQKAAFNSALVAEIAPLLEKHYHEIAHYQDIPLKPDWAKYQKGAELGVLRVYTIRHGCDLVGYMVFFVSLNPHYSSSLQAVVDIVYLDPSLRGKMIGYRFINWCDEQLKAEGVQVVVHHLKAKPELNYGHMLERMGYELVDVLYCKRLDK